MTRTSFESQTSIRLRGKRIPGAEDRQQKIAGFNQATYSASKVVCIGAGGLMSFIAPTLVRKGIGALTILDGDEVEVSNLNRQRFFERDIGRNKALALAQNLQPECIYATELTGYAVTLEEAIERGVDLSCNAAICGVDNNPARVACSRHFRALGIPVIFTAVSADGDHGYVFVQEKEGPCIGCLFPDMADDNRYPCPGTPAIADVLQAVGSLAVYAVDTLLIDRHRAWNYRRICLSDRHCDGSTMLTFNQHCRLRSTVLR